MQEYLKILKCLIIRSIKYLFSVIGFWENTISGENWNIESVVLNLMPAYPSPNKNPNINPADIGAKLSPYLLAIANNISSKLLSLSPSTNSIFLDSVSLRVV